MIRDLSVDHLLGIKQLTTEDIEIIFETADSFKKIINRPIKKVPTLRDVTIANLFFENSTRTRVSTFRVVTGKGIRVKNEVRVSTRYR